VTLASNIVASAEVSLPNVVKRLLFGPSIR